jgi:membrane protease YdiL (CAAX protease family)
MMAGVGLLLVFSLLRRDHTAIHVIVFTFLFTVCGKSCIWPPFWPFFLLGPLVVYGLVVTVTPSLRQSVGWLRAGKLDHFVWWLVILTVFISTAVLVLWFFALRPDLSQWRMAIPTWHPLLLLLLGVGFAVVNAAIEESIYRGILLHALDAAFGSGSLSAILQAIVFGFLHIRGIPNGWIGVGLATIYGLMLGFIRRRAQGMLAPFAAHVFADIVIFILLLLWT